MPLSKFGRIFKITCSVEKTQRLIDHHNDKMIGWAYICRVLHCTPECAETILAILNEEPND